MNVSKWLITLVFATVLSGFSFEVAAQTDCPAGNVCLPQEAANRLLKVAEQLIAAKDVIAKMSAERATGDAVIASAQRVIEDYKKLDEINSMMIVKYKDIVALYERTLMLYSGLVDKLEEKLSKPKTGWNKFLDILKHAAILLSGIALGRAGI